MTVSSSKKVRTTVTVSTGTPRLSGSDSPEARMALTGGSREVVSVRVRGWLFVWRVGVSASSAVALRLPRTAVFLLYIYIKIRVRTVGILPTPN
jgi:hypothetical protein